MGPPSSVSASASSSVIKLTWISPFDPYHVIIGYGISYQIIETSFPLETPRPPVTVAVMSNGTLYTLQSLLANSIYRIVVFAIFDEGAGPVSEEITVQTKEEGIEGALHDFFKTLSLIPSRLDDYAVRDYRCLSHTSDILHCTWQHPVPPDEYYISEYQLAYRLADGFDYYPGYGMDLQRINLSPMVNEYTIDKGLLPYGGYVIELKCVMSPDAGSGSGDFIMDDDDVLENITSTSTVFNITQPSGSQGK